MSVMGVERVRALVAILACASMALLSPMRAIAAPDAPKAASGKTQVVAKMKGRELTLSQLRQEMARLRLSPADPDAERVAMESLLNRTVLSLAARKANIHRRPESIARMYAAQDAALAELYLSSVAQPPEPTRDEIDAYIVENETLFAGRRIYDLAVLTMPSQYFDEATLTPLFDEEADFSRLAAILEKAGADFSVIPSIRASTSFPAPIREQLALYDVSDNIVLKGGDQTQIMKIVRIRPAPIEKAEQQIVARRMLMEAATGSRIAALLERLKNEANVRYYRPSAAPAPSPQKAASNAAVTARTATDNANVGKEM